MSTVFTLEFLQDKFGAEYVELNPVTGQPRFGHEWNEVWQKLDEHGGVVQVAKVFGLGRQLTRRDTLTDASGFIAHCQVETGSDWTRLPYMQVCVIAYQRGRNVQRSTLYKNQTSIGSEFSILADGPININTSCGPTAITPPSIHGGDRKFSKRVFHPPESD